MMPELSFPENVGISGYLSPMENTHKVEKLWLHPVTRKFRRIGFVLSYFCMKSISIEDRLLSEGVTDHGHYNILC